MAGGLWRFLNDWLGKDRAVLDWLLSFVDSEPKEPQGQDRSGSAERTEDSATKEGE